MMHITCLIECPFHLFYLACLTCAHFFVIYIFDPLQVLVSFGSHSKDTSHTTLLTSWCRTAYALIHVTMHLVIILSISNHHLTSCLVHVIAHFFAAVYILSTSFTILYVFTHCYIVLRAFQGFVSFRMIFAWFHIHTCLSWFRWSTQVLVFWFLFLIICNCLLYLMPPERARNWIDLLQ